MSACSSSRSPSLQGIGTSVGRVLGRAGRSEDRDEALPSAGRCHRRDEPRAATPSKPDPGPGPGPPPDPFLSRRFPPGPPTPILAVRDPQESSPHGTQHVPIRRLPPDDGRPPVVLLLDLDDRAAGDDAVFLVPAFYRLSVDGDLGWVGFDNYTWFLNSPAFWLAMQHAAAGGRRAGHHRGAGHPDRASDRPADLGAGDRAHPGDRALLRDAPVAALDLEEHVHAPAERPVRRIVRGGFGPAADPFLEPAIPWRRSS
jgi:hypothetical protein